MEKNPLASGLKILTPEDPRKRLELLLSVVTIFVGYAYLYIYQNILHIKVALYDLYTLLEMPVIAAIVLPLIYYLIIKADPLQRSPSQWKAIRFFQNEFPSRYILERCKRCIENENTCPNYIKAESYTHIKYWFKDIFHGPIESEDPGSVKDTYEKGYTCKLVYYLSWILTVFSVLAMVLMLFQHLYLYIFKTLKFDCTPLQILFPLGCIGIVILIKTLNKADDKSPSGCWHAWREINRMHVSWLKANNALLVQLICRASGGTKMFREK